jgi:hypothetical protein
LATLTGLFIIMDSYKQKAAIAQ